MILDEMHRNQAQQQQSTNAINNQLQHISTRFGELDIWKRNIETQMGQFTAQIPQPSGKLPGHTDPNPKGQTGHIAVVQLRSDHKLHEPKIGEADGTTGQQLDIDHT